MSVVAVWASAGALHRVLYSRLFVELRVEHFLAAHGANSLLVGARLAVVALLVHILLAQFALSLDQHGALLLLAGANQTVLVQSESLRRGGRSHTRARSAGRSGHA